MVQMHLKSQLKDGIGTLVIDRPDARNAFSQAMWQELPVQLMELEKQGARVIVLTGSAGCFSAGADLSELAALASRQDAACNWFSIKNALDYLAVHAQPTIAMIDGPCMGGGLLLALACDLRLCSDNSAFALPVARLGIILDDANLARLVQSVGTAAARQLVYSGREIDALSALQMGLVQEVLSASELAQRVSELSRHIAGNSPEAVAAAKQSFLRITASAACATEPSQDTAVESYLSDDFRQRLGEFTRKP